MVHFVLVHTICHGAWCWYKVKPVLESAGHRVTAIDLAASGMNMAKIEEVHTFSDYTKPLIELMESLPPEEKVTLVGHGVGGINLALAMDSFPHKISAAVFLNGLTSDSTHSPSYILDQFLERNPADSWLDSNISSDLNPVNSKITVLLGSKCLVTKLYQLTSSQDLALAEMLIRPGSLFKEDLSKCMSFSEEGYGSINQVYIVCKKDLTITEDFQHRMIENNSVKEVMEIEDADHMAMLSKPNEVCCCLLDIANKYN
ncbi:salicylic acid-binding protein 2-like isoform X2 [Telopea speciosissima]|uniref:salicylic acid-binding protein 2-like isoform X2 n=1 Tax=Telopea speciosissima TaxID=54955 RepID=UPI001CC7E896|nr:salicylic acid-binding protein 2-like isoform X2 [Telopea speciosissima]